MIDTLLAYLVGAVLVCLVFACLAGLAAVLDRDA